METAISKEKAAELQAIFENQRKNGRKAKIYVNSVISAEQEQKYKEQEKQRDEDLRKIKEE